MRNRTDTDSFARLQSKKGRSVREIHSSSSQCFPAIVTMLSLAFFFYSTLFNSGKLSALRNWSVYVFIGLYVSTTDVREYDLIDPKNNPHVAGYNSFSAPNTERD